MAERVSEVEGGSVDGAGAQAKAIVAGVLVALAVTLTGCCWAESKPHSPYLNMYFYYSVDMRPIEVNFAKCSPYSKPGCKQKIRYKFDIPRAYVVKASPYTKKEYCRFPDKIYVKSVHFAIMEPDGAPMGRGQFSAFGKEARPNVSFVKVTRYSRRPETRKEIIRPSSVFGPDGRWRHLVQYQGRDYFGDAGEGIKRIRCGSNFEKSHPWHTCTYSAIWADRYIVRAQFLDFRRNGDLEYAQRRMRLIKKTLCRYLDCDD